MMEEEEETLFDQENLLGPPQVSTRERSEYKRRLVKTGALSMAFFCLGLCIAIPGPTLLDLGKMVGQDTHHMVLVFTARSLGYLLGSVAGGVLGDLLDQQLLLAFTLGATAFATAGIPWCTMLLTMAVLVAIQGGALGVLDSGGNVFCIRIWGKQSPSYMQLLHFAFAIGAFLAPLIARPFLGDTASVIGANQSSVGLPYTFVVQAFNSLPDTIKHSLEKDKKGVGNDGNSRSERDLGLLLSDNEMSSFLSSFSSSARFSRVQRDALVGSATTSDSFGTSVSINNSIVNVGGSLNMTAGVSSSPVANGTSVDGSIKSPLTIATAAEPRPATAVAASSPPPTAAAPPPRPVPKKPGFINSGSLDPKHADGETNKAKLVDILQNPKVDLAPGDADAAAGDGGSIIVGTTTPGPGSGMDGVSLAGNGTELEGDNSTSQAGKEGGAAGVKGFNESSTIMFKGPTTTAVKPVETTTTAPTTTTTTPTTTTTMPATTTTTTPTTPSTTTPTPTTTTTITAATTTTTTSPPSPPASTKTDDSQDEPLHPTKNEVPPSEDNSKPTFSSSLNKTSTTNNDTLAAQDTFQILFETVRNMSKIQFAYLLIGVLLAANTAIFISLYCRDRAAHRSGPLTAIPSHEDLMRPPHSTCFVLTFLGMLFLFFFTYVGMEVTYGGLLPTFSLDFPDIVDTQAQGASLVALFWGSLAVGRGAAIFVARWFKPPCMMVADLTLTLAGGIILATGISATPKLLWVGTVMIGLGMSSLFPTAMSWANFYYPLSGRAAAVLVAGCGVGEMTVPAVTGQLYGLNHMALMYVVLASACLLVLLFAALQFLACQTAGKGGKAGPPRSHSGFMRLENTEDVADSMDMGLLRDAGVEDSTSDVLPLRLDDLGAVTRRKRGGAEGEGQRQNGAAGGEYEVTEFTKLVELSD